jgi:hypothetical protein
MRSLLLTLMVLSAAVSLHGQDAGQAAAATDATAAKDLNLRAYVELLRSDLRGQKVAIITELLEFTEAEDAAFWPVFREYELELAKINDDRMSLIEEYARNYSKMTEPLADRLVMTALDLESRRTALKSKYYSRLKTTLSPKVAARVIQIEHQILLLIDLQIAASLPVVK